MICVHVLLNTASKTCIVRNVQKKISDYFFFPSVTHFKLGTGLATQKKLSSQVPPLVVVCLYMYVYMYTYVTNSRRIGCEECY